jgi:hypothetical protein
MIVIPRRAFRFCRNIDNIGFVRVHLSHIVIVKGAERRRNAACEKPLSESPCQMETHRLIN